MSVPRAAREALEPRPPFCEVAASLPVAPERGSCAQARRDLVGARDAFCSVERRPDVLELEVQRLEPSQLLLPREVRLRALGQVPDLFGLPPLDPGPLVGVEHREPSPGVLADRLEHREPHRSVGRLRSSDQAVIHEHAERIQHVDVAAAGTLGGFDRAPTREHGEACEQAPGMIGQRLLAPSDRLLEGPMALGCVARPVREQREPLAEPAGQRRGVEHAQAARRQLEGEWQAVEPSDDLGHRGCIALGHPETALRRPGAFDEESYRLRRRDVGHVEAVQVARERERRHPISCSPATCSTIRLVASTLSRGAASSMSPTIEAPGASCSRLSSTSSGSPWWSRSCRVWTGSTPGVARSRSAAGDRRHDERGVLDGAQVHEGDLVVPIEAGRRDLERQSGLPRASRARQRHESCRVERRVDLRDRRAASDERCARRR